MSDHDRSWITGRSFLDRKPVHVHDLLSAEGAEFPNGQKIARSVGYPHDADRALVARGRKHWSDYASPQGSATVQRQTDWLAADLRRSGGDRHRQCPPVRERCRRRRATSPKRCSSRPRPPRYLKVISHSPANCEPVFRRHAGERCEHLRCPVRHDLFLLTAITSTGTQALARRRSSPSFSLNQLRSGRLLEAIWIGRYADQRGAAHTADDTAEAVSCACQQWLAMCAAIARSLSFRCSRKMS